MDRRRDLRTQRVNGEADSRHGHHVLDTAQGVSWRIGVNGGQGTIVAGVHGLQHVQGFAATNLADDDSFGPHTQAVPDEIARGDFTLAFDIRRSRLQSNNVWLLQLQLGGIFDSDDALVGRDITRQYIQHCGLARAGTAGNDDVQARSHNCGQNLGDLIGHGVEFDHVVHAE